MEHEPKVVLVQTMTEEYALYVVDDKGERLASVLLGTNDKKEAGRKVERIIACVVVAGGFTDE